MSRSQGNEQNLTAALAECEKLRTENQRLREQLGIATIEPAGEQALAEPASLEVAFVTAKSSPDGKVKLFRSLFRGREDVYALRWEGRDGKKGYSPACRRVWGNSFQKHSAESKEYFR